MKRRLIITVALVLQIVFAYAAKVDTVNTTSASMHKTIKAVVILPDAYNTKKRYPVVYLLHGYSGNYADWITKATSVAANSDLYNLIIVCPDGDYNSWYFDSPVDSSKRYETYISKELIGFIDNHYATVALPQGRAITGLSMGGHGALYLSTRHPDLFCAAGSMSGALDLNTTHWKISPDFAKQIAPQFERILGPTGATPDLYAANSVVNLADKMKTNGLKLIIDCGVDDFLIEPNRELHRRLVYNQTTHDYTEHPGGHTWEYWENSLPYHVLFFHKILKENGVAVQ